MATYAMLSVDLHDVNSTQRQDFNDEMAAHKWAKVVSLTTVWYAQFKAGTSSSDVVATAEQDVKAAAAAAKINRYDAAVGVCSEKPTVW